jgi:hypothetical protein
MHFQFSLTNCMGGNSRFVCPMEDSGNNSRISQTIGNFWLEELMMAAHPSLGRVQQPPVALEKTTLRDFPAPNNRPPQAWRVIWFPLKVLGISSRSVGELSLIQVLTRWSSSFSIRGWSAFFSTFSHFLVFEWNSQPISSLLLKLRSVTWVNYKWVCSNTSERTLNKTAIN